MGHSLTSFNGKHIRCKDYKVETWLLLIAQEAKTIQDPPDWLKEACKHWEHEGLHGVNGCLDADLDTFLVSEDRIAALLEICNSVNSKLASFGTHVPKGFLNALLRLESPNEIREDNESELYVSYGRRLVDLINGNQQENCVTV